MPLSRLSMYVLLALSVIISVLFFVGGSDNSVEVGGDTIEVPNYTDALLYWCYILCVLTIVVALIGLVGQFVRGFKNDSKSALKSFAGVGALALIIILSFATGSADKIELLGYDGNENFGFWAQFSDMCINSCIVLVVLAFLAIVCTSVYNKLRK